MARARGDTEEQGKAERMYLRTIQGKAKVLGPTHPSANRSMLRLAEMYERWGKRERRRNGERNCRSDHRKFKVQELTVQSFSSKVAVQLKVAV
jgi:hypothetical protein